MERLAKDGAVAVSALSKGLGVSESSVRRDLSLLEAQKWISRTHGGAVVRGAPLEFPLSQRSVERMVQKTAIAEVAMHRVTAGAKVGLTAGATTAAIGRLLPDRPGVTVVTNAVDIAYQLLVHRELRVILTGGLADPDTVSTTGPFTEAMLAQINLDVLFLEPGGVHPTAGVTVDSDSEAHVLRAFVRCAQRVVAVCDSSHAGRTCFARVCDLDALDELITDPESSDALTALTGAGLAATTV